MDQDIPANLAPPDILKELYLSQSLRKLIALVDQLSVSADFKAVFHDLATATWQAGTTVVTIGRKIASAAIDVLNSFSGTSFGGVIASIVTLIVWTTTLFGLLLSALFGPIMLAQVLE